MGFETQHRHYHKDVTGRMLFNALRILSYIPIISTVCALIKGCLDIYYTEKKIGERLSRMNELLKIQNQDMETLHKDMKNHIDEGEAVLPVLETNREIIKHNLSITKQVSTVDLTSGQQVKSFAQVKSETMKAVQEDCDIIEERRSQSHRDIEDLMSAASAAQQLREFVDDGCRDIKKERSEINNRLVRLVVEAFWPLGVLLLPVDLYYTAFKPQKIEVLTDRTA